MKMELMDVIEMIEKVQQFFSYWYLRYMLATELYMVETWEKVAVYILFSILFALVWIFNYNIVLSAAEITSKALN